MSTVVSRRAGEPERGREKRQPEIEDAIREHREHRGRKRDARPRERERKQRLYGARPAVYDLSVNEGEVAIT